MYEWAHTVQIQVVQESTVLQARVNSSLDCTVSSRECEKWFDDGYDLKEE